ncbi:MAG: hypothetical protein ACRDRW_01535 [Pseudonocardiaceae bacterium]
MTSAEEISHIATLPSWSGYSVGRHRLANWPPPAWRCGAASTALGVIGGRVGERNKVKEASYERGWPVGSVLASRAGRR